MAVSSDVTTPLDLPPASTPTSSLGVTSSRLAKPSPSVNGLQGAGAATLLDNVATYPTPEGLVLSLMPAGLMPRLSAWLIDALIKGVAFTIIGLVGMFFGKGGAGLIAIGYFVVSWLYPVYFEVYRDGMTPGKKSKGIYVCHDDGTPITLQASLIRNLLRVADFLPIAFTSAALTILFTQKSQRIGDIVAGTIVVYRNDEDVATLFQQVYGGVAHHEDNAHNHAHNHAQNHAYYQNNAHNLNATNLAATTAPLFVYPLTLVEQQALLAFAERRPYLSHPRQLEIATALLPLLSPSLTSYPKAALNVRQEAQILATLLTRINRIRGYDPSIDHAHDNHSNHADNNASNAAPFTQRGI